MDSMKITKSIRKDIYLQDYVRIVKFRLGLQLEPSCTRTRIANRSVTTVWQCSACVS
jgi:ribosomal protein L37AE/L43A